MDQSNPLLHIRYFLLAFIDVDDVEKVVGLKVFMEYFRATQKLHFRKSSACYFHRQGDNIYW